MDSLQAATTRLYSPKILLPLPSYTQTTPFLKQTSTQGQQALFSIITAPRITTVNVYTYKKVIH